MKKIFHYSTTNITNLKYDEEELRVNNYAQKWELDIYETVRETRFSNVGYQYRDLGDLLKRMGIGDSLIVAELSQLGSSMANIMSIINIYLIRLKINLIIVDVELKINCAKSNSCEIKIFSMMEGFERQSKIDKIAQVQAMIQAKFDRGESHTSKAGNVLNGWGRQDEKWLIDCRLGGEASGKARMERIKANPERITIYNIILHFRRKYGADGKPTPFKEIIENYLVDETKTPEWFKKNKIPPLTEASISKALRKGYY